jgi:hypothetical protein
VSDLQALLAVLNAALEHVPAQTRAILAETAKPALASLEKSLAAKSAPAIATDRSPCD